MLGKSYLKIFVRQIFKVLATCTFRIKKLYSAPLQSKRMRRDSRENNYMYFRLRRGSHGACFSAK